jgi:NAD(P)-dependent dehydrogenase (short-subunit alcohol dehydrogenase family)
MRSRRASSTPGRGTHSAKKGKRDYFAHISKSNPTGTIGTPEDVAEAVLFAMTNAFLTGMTLKIDGGEPLT